MWKLVATGFGVATAVLVRKALTRTWSRRRGGAPPGNPADAETSWREAAVFAALSGLAVGLARLLSDRVAAEAWHRVRGTYPPGIARGVRRITETTKRRAALART